MRRPDPKRVHNSVQKIGHQHFPLADPQDDGHDDDEGASGTLSL